MINDKYVVFLVVVVFLVGVFLFVLYSVCFGLGILIIVVLMLWYNCYGNFCIIDVEFYKFYEVF